MVLLKKYTNLRVSQVNYRLIKEDDFTTALYKNNDKDTVMYLTHDEYKPIAAERCIRTFKDKVYRKMAPNNSEYYFGYLNKL